MLHDSNHFSINRDYSIALEVINLQMSEIRTLGPVIVIPVLKWAKVT